MSEDIKKLKIAIAGYSLNSSQGLSHISQALLSRFLDIPLFDMAYITIGGDDSTHEGMTIWDADFYSKLENLTLHNCQLLNRDKVLLFDDFIKEWKPNILISICDPWMHDQFSYSPYRSTYFWCAYQHIETPEYPEFVMMPTTIVPNLRKSIKNMLQSTDLLIPVTEMGKNTLLKYGFTHITDNIYNGLNIEDVVTQKITKKAAFGNNVKEDDYIFMTMGVNNERKKIDRTIEAFSKFLIKKKNNNEDTLKYKLYLHVSLDAVQGGTDLKEMIMKLNLQPNVLIVGDYKKDVGVAKKELFVKYRACDCFISLTGGEGMGLGYLEAIAHDKPVIYTNYGGHVEFCKDFGIAIPVKDYTNAQNGYIKFALADTDAAAEAMIKISSDKNLSKKLDGIGYNYVKTNFNWDILFDKFLRLLIKNYEVKFVNSNQIQFPIKRIV